MPPLNLEMYLNEIKLLCNVMVAGGEFRIWLPFSTRQAACWREFSPSANWRIKLLVKVWENMASRVWGELGLSSFTCQLKEHLPKQFTNGSMLLNANETPNYFKVSILHWHRRFLRGLTSCASMPNVDSSLRRNRWTAVPTGWRDG